MGKDTYIIKNWIILIVNSWFPATNSNKSDMYMYNGMSVFISKNVSSHGMSIGLRPISLTTVDKEAIGSSIKTSCLFGLGFRRDFYKIKNICIKLDVIYKYKLI